LAEDWRTTSLKLQKAGRAGGAKERNRGGGVGKVVLGARR